MEASIQNTRTASSGPGRALLYSSDVVVADHGQTSVLPFPDLLGGFEDASREAETAETDVRRWDLRDFSCRVVNILAATAGLLVSLPLMLLIAAAIKLSSRGPVLYTQPRVGVDRRSGRDRRSRVADPGRRESDAGGRIFTIYKFRTMRCEGPEGREVWSRPDDPRVTPVGSFLRKMRLDELPQLWNVLKGDMNIVGPRPEQPRIFWDLRQHVRDYPRRQRVLPGITGWAQVNHGYDQSLEDVKKKVDLDLEYIRRRSVLEDLRIMALTLPVVFLGRGPF